MFDSVTTMAPYIRSGKVKGLATTGLKRTTILPDLPTMSEAGVPGYESEIWLGVMAPAGTPKAIVDRLNAEISHFESLPETKAAWAKQGTEPMIMTSEQFGAYIKKDIAKWAPIVKRAGLKVD